MHRVLVGHGLSDKRPDLSPLHIDREERPCGQLTPCAEHTPKERPLLPLFVERIDDTPDADPVRAENLAGRALDAVVQIEVGILSGLKCFRHHPREKEGFSGFCTAVIQGGTERRAGTAGVACPVIGKPWVAVLQKVLGKTAVDGIAKAEEIGSRQDIAKHNPSCCRRRLPAGAEPAPDAVVPIFRIDAADARHFNQLRRMNLRYSTPPLVKPVTAHSVVSETYIII